jgi:tRNA U34 5-carboxymethylaminomethyl modifying enzyme MnmG/GidA
MYTNYIKREDKDAACLHSNIDAALPEGFEYQVLCDV